jgi:hypothetical protein
MLLVLTFSAGRKNTGHKKTVAVQGNRFKIGANV